MGRTWYTKWPSSPDEAAKRVIFEDGGTESGVDETDKLKGVRYPGMGLFDAASETEKRKRNQRKDDSVLKRMVQTSEGIEPTECVWGPGGDLERTRDIFDSPSVEGTPVSHVFHLRLLFLIRHQYKKMANVSQISGAQVRS